MSAEARIPAAGGDSDPFERVLGHGRGLNDLGLLGAELQQAKDALAEAVAGLQDARSREDALQDVVARLTDDLGRMTREQGKWQWAADQAEMRNRKLRVGGEQARYAAMRLGHRDPVPDWPFERTHHGVWTPGRPYLAYSHVWHPKTGDCYCTDNGGAPIGEAPGTDRHWQSCMESSGCPEPVPLPTDEMEHPCDGEAVRQSQLWWDRTHAAWRIKEIDDEYLANIIDYLRSHARQLCAGEARWPVPFVPCPWNAYSSPAAWLADTPLMHALLRERRRRRAAARREAARRGAAAS
jgi:hypothetical protein